MKMDRPGFMALHDGDVPIPVEGADDIGEQGVEVLLRPFGGVDRVAESNGEKDEMLKAVKLGGQFDVGLEAEFRLASPLGNLDRLPGLCPFGIILQQFPD